MATQHKYGTESLDAWVAEDNLSCSRIMSGINESLDSYYLDPEEASALRKNFESLPMDESGTRRLTENALLKLLQRNPAFRSSPMGTQAGTIIYESLVYLASAPFEAPPESSNKGLTYDELARTLIPVRRDPGSTSVQENAFHLRDLSIARLRFKTLVKMLLALHLEVGTGCGGLLRNAECGFERAAASITAAFARDPNIGITWPMFDFALKNVAVSSLEESIKYALSSPSPLLPRSTPSSESIHMDFFKLATEVHYLPSHLPTALTSINTFKQIKDSVISGVDEQGTQYMFGAFIPTPSLDAQAIQDREHPH
ncbi:hypothetical protein K505DRAFT_336937 [Melanomma pulvis-pyrius CBS 109.77]|uniref:Uncharacterized protein n=1 Tax=Melanomma pulvis-pyrius CBS 109.77 TaxID=1314802 RepID=A0A6A6XDA7_9PLEO|nr:hypothetical protein K505DRAFT_336937 [Melanomma pulvis-pyrius CBS 109.77]